MCSLSEIVIIIMSRGLALIKNNSLIEKKKQTEIRAIPQGDRKWGRCENMNLKERVETRTGRKKKLSRK